MKVKPYDEDIDAERMPVGELLEFFQDRYDIQFQLNPADFKVKDSRQVYDKIITLRVRKDQDLGTILRETLKQVNAVYVIEDRQIRILPAKSEEK